MSAKRLPPLRRSAARERVWTVPSAFVALTVSLVNDTKVPLLYN